MEQQLKQRLSGMVVLVSLAVIVLPLLLDGEGYRKIHNMEIEAPQRPPFRYQQDGFTTPLKDLNSTDDLLDAPQPMEVKKFDENSSAPTSSEQGEVQSRLQILPPNVSDNLPSTAQPGATTTWVVQVGSFSVEANAEAVREKIAAMQAENTIIEIETEQVDELKVYVVKVVSDDYESLSKITRLIKKDYPDAFIKERE